MNRQSTKSIGRFWEARSRIASPAGALVAYSCGMRCPQFFRRAGRKTWWPGACRIQSVLVPVPPGPMWSAVGGAGHRSPSVDSFVESVGQLSSIRPSGCWLIGACAPDGLALGAHVWTEGGFHSVAWLVSFVIILLLCFKKIFLCPSWSQKETAEGFTTTENKGRTFHGATCRQ